MNVICFGDSNTCNPRSWLGGRYAHAAALVGGQGVQQVLGDG